MILKYSNLGQMYIFYSSIILIRGGGRLKPVHFGKMGKETGASLTAFYTFSHENGQTFNFRGNYSLKCNKKYLLGGSGVKIRILLVSMKNPVYPSEKKNCNV